MNEMAVQPTILQRGARGLMVGLCGAMAIGLFGAVAVRGMDRTDARATAAGNGVVLAAQGDTSRAGELVVDATPAFAGFAVETNAPVLLASNVEKRPRTIYMEVTGYCACSKCCGPAAKGITASGKRVSYNKGRFVAADTKVLPFGTKLSIPGYHAGRPVEVIDRGGAIKGNKLDLYFPTHQAALEWGRQRVVVTVME